MPYWNRSILDQLNGKKAPFRDEPLALPENADGACTIEGPQPWGVKDKATGTGREAYAGLNPSQSQE